MRGQMMNVRDGLAVTPWQIMGYRADGRPIYAIAGGSAPAGEGESFETGDDNDDADGDDDDDDDDDEGASGSDGGGDNSSTPPSGAGGQSPPVATTNPALKRALDAERVARKQLTKDLAALRREHATDTEKVQLDAEAAAVARYKPVAVKAAARASLLAAGVKDATRVIRLLDTDALDVDDDGDVPGLEEAVTALKSEFPELFATGSGTMTQNSTPPPARVKPPKGSPDGANKPPVPPEPKSSAEKLAAGLLGS